jgi:hypothetical protein
MLRWWALRIQYRVICSTYTILTCSIQRQAREAKGRIQPCLYKLDYYYCDGPAASFRRRFPGTRASPGPGSATSRGISMLGLVGYSAPPSAMPEWMVANCLGCTNSARGVIEGSLLWMVCQSGPASSLASKGHKCGIAP